jgi:hypothetical protein
VEFNFFCRWFWAFRSQIDFLGPTPASDGNPPFEKLKFFNLKSAGGKDQKISIQDL